jgi:CCR4-NOT transcription complex subunit 1
MEVYAKYFRRLLSGNAPQIFPGINRNVENPGNYPLLVEEVQKASRDIYQAQKVAEIIDTYDGADLRDFDLGTFVSHFKLDPVSQTIFVAAFAQVTKQDLRAKGTHRDY